MSVKKTSYRSRKSHSKKVFGVAAVLLILVAVVAALELTNTTHFFHAKTAVSGKIPVISSGKTPASTSKNTTSQTPATSKTTTTSPTNTTNTVDKSSGTGQGTNQPSTLQTPFGSFVSNHSANLSGSPSQEQSFCITSPGASCTMTFTNDSGIVKTLPGQTADSSGNVSWVWDVNSAGFTTGNWKITATASLNGQSKTTTDQLPLKVQP